MKHSKQASAWAGLLFVVLIWGTSPLLTLYFYDYYSPTIRVTLAAFTSAVALGLLSFKKLHLLDLRYLKIAVPTGIFYTAANMLQKIGLQFTTPAHYAVLEQLSCVVVPVLLFLLIRRKPSWLTMLAAGLCLCSTVILTGFSANAPGVSSLGDILCALAGIFYGFNTAATGIYAKKLDAPLYLMVQMLTETVISGICAVVFHSIGFEAVQFTFDWRIVLAHAVFVLFTSTIGWVIRTNALKHVDASVVAVIMPFSSAVTAVLSVALGKDAFTWNLAAGVLIGLLAIILSGLGEQTHRKPAAARQPRSDKFVH